MRHVLFLCTGNSARSILAEAILTANAAGRFKAHSAGSAPTGTPNPWALKCLENHGHDTSFAASKSWDAFAGPNAPDLHFIITVCDNAAGETCPIWPGHPATSHWGLPDPAGLPDTDSPAAFERTYQRLSELIDGFLALPVDGADPASLKHQITALNS